MANDSQLRASEIKDVLLTEIERYEDGSYFDLQPGKWTTVEEANRDHATLANRLFQLMFPSIPGK